jgi:uncharacterized protein YbaP (TraB family)
MCVRSVNNKFFKEFKNKKLEDKILYQRNEKMAERVDKLIRNNPNKEYIFAFGLLHFLGKKSIIELLEAKGYNVKKQNIFIKKEIFINE